MARRPGPEPRFSREQLARRALAIMDAHGTEALTMRRLAAEPGMGTMALYRYFPSKNDLMDAAIDVAAPELEPGSGPSREWTAPPGRSPCSSTVTSQPAAARFPAQTRPLWPAPITRARNGLTVRRGRRSGVV
jgi:hypothetical protein